MKRTMMTRTRMGSHERVELLAAERTKIRPLALWRIVRSLAGIIRLLAECRLRGLLSVLVRARTLQDRDLLPDPKGFTSSSWTEAQW